MTLLSVEGPDRGLNLAVSNDYRGILALARIRLRQYDRAADAIRETLHRNRPLDDYDNFRDVIAASQGDVAAVRSALEPRVRSGTLDPQRAAFLTTLLRTTGGREADGAALVTAWAPKLPASIPPGSAATCAAACWLLASTGQWAEMSRQLDAAETRADAFFRTVHGSAAHYRRQMRRMYRAVASVHVGRMAEAAAIDSAFALSAGARWDMGLSELARAAIATHRGDTVHAIAFLERAVNAGLIGWWRLDFRKFAIEGDPFLLPLRIDPHFKTLTGPDPSDGK